MSVSRGTGVHFRPESAAIPWSRCAVGEKPRPKPCRTFCSRPLRVGSPRSGAQKETRAFCASGARSASITKTPCWRSIGNASRRSSKRCTRGSSGDAKAGAYARRTSQGDSDLERILRTYRKPPSAVGRPRPGCVRSGTPRPVESGRLRPCSPTRACAAAHVSGGPRLPRQLDHPPPKARWVCLVTTLRAPNREHIVCRRDARPDAEASALAQAPESSRNCTQCAQGRLDPEWATPNPVVTNAARGNLYHAAIQALVALDNHQITKSVNL